MKILTGENNEILRKKSQKVKQFDKKLAKLVKDMEVTVKEEKGVGLAAPQVGVNQCVILVKMKDRFFTMVNPEITAFSQETDVKEEGCLSLPDTWGKVRRATAVIVQFQDITGKNMTLELSDMEARIVQHETDHLHGILFTDQLALNQPISQNSPSVLI